MVQQDLLHQRKFDGVADALQEIALEASELREGMAISFEHSERLSRVERKVRFLLRKAHTLRNSSQIVTLQERLRTMISCEAWEVYLDIEGLANRKFEKNSLGGDWIG